MASPPSPQPLLSIRTTVILTVGLVLGMVIGVLTVLADQHPALAIAVGLGAAGTSIATLHKLIGT
ncbi:hypothetical protein ACU61A_41245 [Pseudonocardia sichuanensis]